MQSVCLLNSGLDNSRSSLVFKMRNKFFFRMLYSTAIIDHSNMLKPYMEVLILSVLHIPPENHPSLIAGKLLSY